MFVQADELSGLQLQYRIKWSDYSWRHALPSINLAIDLLQSGILRPIITCHKELHLSSQCTMWLYQKPPPYERCDKSRSVYPVIAQERRQQVNIACNLSSAQHSW